MSVKPIQPRSASDEPHMWALVIHDGPATDKLVAIRAALGVGISDVAALTRLLPGVVRRGTRVELTPALKQLQQHHVRAELHPSAAYLRVEDILQPHAGLGSGSRIVVPLDPDDFGPLADCPLVWRWTDKKYNVLPNSSLAQIRPLCPAKARLVWEVLASLIDPKLESLATTLFEEVESTDTGSNPATVRAWLQYRVPAEVGDVILSWQPEIAVVTNINLLCRYWDDFCYPASDDVTVWSVNDDWAAVYHHDDRLFVGKRAMTPTKSI